jgi:hypothetical protein
MARANADRGSLTRHGLFMPLHFLSRGLSLPARTKVQRRQLALGNTVTFFCAQAEGGERGSIWTVTLQKVADSWRITGWAWSKHVFGFVPPKIESRSFKETSIRRAALVFATAMRGLSVRSWGRRLAISQ